MQRPQFKALASYIAGATLLSIYGAQVCPFIESLRFGEILLTLGAFFLVGAGFRSFVLALARRRGELISNRPWRLLLLDLAIWMFVGLAATGWNIWRYHFPVESGLKIVIGSLTIGVLASTYLALEAEESLIRSCQSNPDAFQRKSARFMSLSTKFLVFITASLVLFSAVIVLLVFKDFDYVLKRYDAAQANSAMIQRPQILKEISIEVAFVLTVLLGGSLVIARQYARNLRLMFALLQNAFQKVEQGVFSTRVPVVSNDEFSHIAKHTNQMILGLQDRERIKTIFGKYVSPSVADSIMKSETGSELGGREVRVAILFTDIRNYTTLSERLTASQVVEFLNSYFTRIVEAVHGAGGILDKFIGDAAMAVFGVDGTANPSSRAVDAALQIRSALLDVNDQLRQKGYPPIDNGVGIHYGAVVAGNIGSPQRLEYTVIGDAVNTASRIESLCKTQTRKILISGDAYENLPDARRRQFSFIGEFELKGKSKSVPIYGAADGSL